MFSSIFTERANTFEFEGLLERNAKGLAHKRRGWNLEVWVGVRCTSGLGWRYLPKGLSLGGRRAVCAVTADSLPGIENLDQEIKNGSL